MYELWGGGGSPFKCIENDVLQDCSGTKVRLLGDAGKILEDVRKSSVISAFVSTCDEPEWAFECLDLFRTTGRTPLKECVNPEHQLIYKVFHLYESIYNALGQQAASFPETAERNGHQIRKYALFRQSTQQYPRCVPVGSAMHLLPRRVVRQILEKRFRYL